MSPCPVHRGEAAVTDPACDTGWLHDRVNRLRAGDRAAADDLLRAVGGRLERLARRMLRGYPVVRSGADTGDVQGEAPVTNDTRDKQGAERGQGKGQGQSKQPQEQKPEIPTGVLNLYKEIHKATAELGGTGHPGPIYGKISCKSFHMT